MMKRKLLGVKIMELNIMELNTEYLVDMIIFMNLLYSGLVFLILLDISLNL